MGQRKLTPTPGELEVISHLAAGLTYEAIGRRLHITPDTVKGRMRSAFRKAGVNSQTQLVHWAWVHGHLGDRQLLLETNEKLRGQVARLQALHQAALQRARRMP